MVSVSEDVVFVEEKQEAALNKDFQHQQMQKKLKADQKARLQAAQAAGSAIKQPQLKSNL